MILLDGVTRKNDRGTMIIEQDFKFTGGRLSLDFVATLRARDAGAIELLENPAALRIWIEKAHPSAQTHLTEITANDLDAALALREATYGVIEAAREGVVPNASDVELINKAASAPSLAPRLSVGDDGLRQELTAEPNLLLEGLFSEIARDVIELVSSGSIKRVKTCSNHKCERMFFDDSQAQRRRWCSMERCGNRSKVKRYRSKSQPET